MIYYTTSAGSQTTTATSATNAGTYTVWAASSNACGVSATRTQVTLTINKADATVSVSGYTGTYDGNAHGAIGTATGVGGANLNGSLNLGATFTNAPGGTANWSFSGGTNYNDQSGSVAIVINKKNASVTPSVASKVYGATDPSLTGSLSGFVSGDGITASYSRSTGESVAGSPYTINATLSPAGALDNYNITYNTANFTITKKPIAVTAVRRQKCMVLPIRL